MKKSTLDDHADLILELLRRGGTNDHVRQALLAKQVSISLEAVRTWINSNPEAVEEKKRYKERQKATLPVSLHFVPDISSEISIPPFLDSILKMFSGRTISQFDERIKAAAGVLEGVGIQIDLTVSPSGWILPTKALSSLSDLELTLIEWLLSDRPGPPTHGASSESRTWLFDLMVATSQMKAKIKEGIDFSISELG